MNLLPAVVSFLVPLALTSHLSGQPFTIPIRDHINGEISCFLRQSFNGKFNFGATINYGKISTEWERNRAKRLWEYTYEYTTVSNLHIVGPVIPLDSTLIKEFRFYIPSMESGVALKVFRNGVPYYELTCQEEPGEMIWKEPRPGIFQLTCDPKDRLQARVVWNQGRTEESWGEERIQPDGTFTVDPAHLLKPDVLVIVETQRGLRFKRKFLRPGVGEIPQPEWLD